MRRVMLVVLFVVLICAAQDAGMNYLNFGGLLMDFPTGGFVFCSVTPDAPEGFYDTTYSGTARVSIVEENPDSSAFFFDLMSGETLGNVIEIPVSAMDEDMMFAIANNESEFMILCAEDVAGELKPSVPVGIYVTPSGSEAVAMSFDGPVRWPIEVEGMFIPLRIFPVDDNDLPVPDYYSSYFEMDAIQVRIIIESIDDGSAAIEGMIPPAGPGDSIVVAALGGAGYIVPTNTQAEIVMLEVTDMTGGGLTADTFVIEFFDSGAFTIIGAPFDGVANTINYPTSCIAMAMNADNEPDEGDDTTVVTMDLFDITGTASVTISPDEATLTTGATIFNVEDTEPDTLGIFVKPRVLSGSVLSSAFWAPIVYLPESEPTRFFYYGPNAITVGETAMFTLRLVNDFGEICTPHEGYKYYFQPDIDDGGYITIIDYATDSTYSDGYWMPILWDTLSPLGITADEAAEEIEMSFRDAEERGFFDSGYLKASQMIEFSVLPVSGAAAGHYELYPPNSLWLFQTGVYFQVDVFATDGYGAVDTTYNGTIITEITGDAYVTESVDIENGHGIMFVYDDSEEDVILNIVGELISPPAVTLHFLDPGSGGVPVIITDFHEELLAGENVDNIVIVSSVSGFASSYTGVVNVIVDEPDDDGTVTCPGTIEIVNGIGSLPFVDSEPETVFITLESADLIPMENMIVVHAGLILEIDDTVSIEDTHEVYIAAVDFDGNPCLSINSDFLLNWYEEFPNSSVEYYGVPTFIDGVCILEIINLEQEYLDLFIEPLTEEPLIVIDGDHSDEDGWFMKTLYFHYVGISEKLPLEFSVGKVTPNPFNSTTEIDITMPEAGSVSLDIIDITGKIIEHRIIELSAGFHSISLDFDEETSGLYFARIRFGEKEVLRRAALVK